ncbi:Holliday junction resolvase RuvX [Neomegalonema sp.]|uniref:Holliday junction resolvase RuvX n=1 Tax=Neomegalonema sp. TaxID=2039713 RepID=UPI00260ACEA2|nr:Holliday junction resolvase RuvX [Neomegalonema sp.]MDD2868044.1 Holliday junction resolvase RuvX [Neomegalonema sp.]
MNGLLRPMTVEELAEILPQRGPLLGLDPGAKTIGLAVSDGLRRTAAAVETIRRGKFAEDAARLAAFAAERGVCGIVLGLPLNMDGTEGPRVQSVRAFARNLAAVLPLPMAFWDERLSTAAVERAMLEADLTRGKRAAVVDRLAAAYILQGALDRLEVLARFAAGASGEEDEEDPWR